MNDSNFEQWATGMYMRNCKERAMYKQEPYTDRETYITKNLSFLKEKYLKAHAERASGSATNDKETSNGKTQHR